MAKSNVKAVAKTKPPHVDVTAPENGDGTRIRAFLAKVRPLRGCSFGDDDEFWEARSLIEGLAVSYDAETDHEWGLLECAAVLRFLHSIEPVESKCYCSDRDNDEVSATCGHMIILETLESELRRTAQEGKKRRRAA